MPWFRLRNRRGAADAVRQLRVDHAMTQSELAEAMTSSRSTVSRLERGDDVALESAFRAFAEMDYELIAIPRGSKVTIAP